jgi:hypothetical protein
LLRTAPQDGDDACRRSPPESPDVAGQQARILRDTDIYNEIDDQFVLVQIIPSSLRLGFLYQR